MVLIIPHVNSEFSALIFDWKVTLSSQIKYLSLLRLLHLRNRKLEVRNGPIFANLIHRDIAFLSAHLRSGVIAFFLHFQLGKLRQVRSNPFLQVGIPESCHSFSQGYLLWHVLFDTLMATWEILSIPGKQVCESDKGFWQSSPISSFKFLFKKQGFV